MSQPLPPTCDECDGCAWIYVYGQGRFMPCPVCNPDGKLGLGGKKKAS